MLVRDTFLLNFTSNHKSWMNLSLWFGRSRFWIVVALCDWMYYEWVVFMFSLILDDYACASWYGKMLVILHRQLRVWAFGWKLLVREPTHGNGMVKISAFLICFINIIVVRIHHISRGGMLLTLPKNHLTTQHYLKTTSGINGLLASSASPKLLWRENLGGGYKNILD